MQHIFIVGAARSGTHLLSTLLRGRIECAYAGEINGLWRQAAGRCRHDMFPAALAEQQGAEVVRTYFEKLARQEGKRVILEKTAANSLRLPFVYRLFPEASYIHIVRDGRDVAISARRKYLGDIRKITSAAEQPAPPAFHRLRHLAEVAHQKISMGLTPGQLLRDAGRYASGALSALGIRQQTLWGPRFPGMKELIESHSLLEVAALQWRASVDAVSSFVAATPSARITEVRFEDLIEHPERILDEILDFLGDDTERLEGGAGNSIEPLKTVGAWRDQLQDHELHQLHELILSTLQHFGYAAST